MLGVSDLVPSHYFEIGTLILDLLSGHPAAFFYESNTVITEPEQVPSTR